MFLFSLFVITPIVEMLLLIEVGSTIGALNTVALVLLTAMLGLALLRKQGLDTLLRANQKIQSGDVPAQEMAEGLALAAGGALLLTPGFITDGIGFCLLLPFTRQLLVRTVFHKIIAGMAVSGSFQSTVDGQSFTQTTERFSNQEGGTTIEGEYTEFTKEE